MKIGIDVSQMAYQRTGVASYLENLVNKLIENEKHEFVLFFSSLRQEVPISIKEMAKKSNVKLKAFKFPPTVLHLIWNKLHKFPIETFVGDIDLFITSDWSEPPAKKAVKATIIYDLIVITRPNETDKKIIKAQKAKLKWVEKESQIIFCISKSTKNDIIEFLNINSSKIFVIYPGFSDL